MGRHPRPDRVGDPGTRAAVVIGSIGLSAVLLVCATWWYVAGLPAKKIQTALLDPAPSAAALPTAGATLGEVAPAFVVPTPSFATPSLTAPLGTLEPELPPEVTTAVVVPPPPPAPPAPAPPPPTPTVRPPSGPLTVSGVQLACALQGKRVRATLSFVSSGPVSVTLVAGTRSDTSVAAGQVSMSVVGIAPGGAATCSAVVNSVSYGPVPAR